MDRRRFLESLAAISATASLPSYLGARSAAEDRLGELLRQRPLGSTGEMVTMLGVGGWHIGRMSEGDAQATIEVALEGGIRFFDSAESYQDGGSERYLGRFLVPAYRDIVFLMTKSTASKAEEARRHLGESLDRLKTDYLDLWQIHGISSPEDVDERLAGGVLEVFQRAREEGVVRHIGFTGHARPDAHLRMLERAADAFQVVQMPVNAADPSYKSFVLNVLPELVGRGIGILAMKTLANGGFFGGSRHGEHGDNPRLVPDRLDVEQAVRYAWSYPISVLVSGPDNPQMMQEKIEMARAFEPLDEENRRALVDAVADLAGGRVEFYKQ